MTIKDQSRYALRHPAFKQAVKNYQDGSDEDLEYILCILQKETADKTREAALRTYTQWKNLNTCDIKIELRRMEIPDNLDVRMPIVKPKESFTRKVTNKIKTFLVPENQLSLFNLA